MEEEQVSVPKQPRAPDVGEALLLLLVCILGIFFLSNTLHTALGSSVAPALVQLVLILLPCALFFLMGRFSLRESLPLAPLSLPHALGAVLLGLSLWLPALLFLRLGLWIFGNHMIGDVEVVLQNTIQSVSGRWGALGLVFILAVLPGLVEEFLFRGLVLRALLRSFSVGTSVFLSALAFGAFHLNLPQGFATMAVGIFLALAASRTQTIYTSMIAHATHNVLIVFLSLPAGDTLVRSLLERPSRFLMVVSLAILLAVAGFWLFAKENTTKRKTEEEQEREQLLPALPVLAMPVTNEVLEDVKTPVTPVAAEEYREDDLLEEDDDLTVTE